MPAPDKHAARRLTRALLASALIRAFGASTLHWEELDAAIGCRPDTCLRYIDKLIRNCTDDLGRAADIAWALGATIEFRVVPLPIPRMTAADIGLEG